MDSIRGMFGVGIANLMVLGIIAPAAAEMNDREEDHRRIHGQRQAHAVSHQREDYPVIFNWLSTPESPNGQAK